MRRKKLVTEQSLNNLADLVDATERPVPWSVIEGEYLSYHSHHATTLDRVIKQELARLTPAKPRPAEWDKAVWRGKRLMAVIRITPDGTPEVVRIGE